MYTSLELSKKLKEAGGEPNKIPEKTTVTLLQAILKLLESIEENQRRLMGKEGIVWDD